jgi:cellulose synthase/poly-beta-1,6-N-acetylglucosamine synthase-like glycosyltransferase
MAAFRIEFAEYLALSAILVLIYTYAGYPLLAALWARLAPRPILGRDGFEPTVSICLSVYNGAAHLRDKLRNLQSLDYRASKLQFLVYSDGSTDATEDLLAEFAKSDSRMQFLSSPARLGKPTALNRLLQIATGEVLLLCDVRQRMGPGALKALLRPLSDPSIGCVSGTLVLTGETGPSLYWRYERLIRASEGRIGAMVGVSGCVYAVRRADMSELPHDILLDDMFVPLRMALTTRKRIVLAESAEAHDTAYDDDREFSRKVRTLAGNYQLIAKMPQLLIPGMNPVWFQMVSHKLLRLACPWALAFVFLTSLWLMTQHNPPTPSGFWTWRALFFAQCLFYGLALFGSNAKRPGNLARTFVVLNAAAVVGLFRFVRGSQAITW